VEELAQKFNVWVTEVNNFEEALAMISDFGILTGKEEKAVILIESIKLEFNLLLPSSNFLNAAYLIWKNPYMTVGGDTFINNMLQLAGFNNVGLAQ
jgi:ABC-type Fe3+-hydroxamate transport system substrate-binding protein